MHVRIDASIEEWHRPKLDPRRPGTYKLETACSKPFGGYYMTRDQTYRGGSLCPTCFTADEIAEAEAWAAEEKERLHAEAEAWEKERAESMQRALEESRQRRERFRTGETKPFPKPDPDPEDG